MVFKDGCRNTPFVLNEIAHHMVVDVIYRHVDTLINPLNKCILKIYQFNTVIINLDNVFIGININFDIKKIKPYLILCLYSYKLTYVNAFWNIMM